MNTINFLLLLFQLNYTSFSLKFSYFKVPRSNTYCNFPPFQNKISSIVLDLSNEDNIDVESNIHIIAENVEENFSVAISEQTKDSDSNSFTENTDNAVNDLDPQLFNDGNGETAENLVGELGPAMNENRFAKIFEEVIFEEETNIDHLISSLDHGTNTAHTAKNGGSVYDNKIENDLSIPVDLDLVDGSLEHAISSSTETSTHEITSDSIINLDQDRSTATADPVPLSPQESVIDILDDLMSEGAKAMRPTENDFLLENKVNNAATHAYQSESALKQPTSKAGIPTTSTSTPSTSKDLTFVLCSACKTAYYLSASDLGRKGRRIKCSICDKDWFQTQERLMSIDNDVIILEDLTAEKIADVKRILADRNIPRNPRVDKFTVFVGNLPYNFQEKELGDLFGEYGLLSAAVVRDPGGLSKGFGFIDVWDTQSGTITIYC